MSAYNFLIPNSKSQNCEPCEASFLPRDPHLGRGRGIPEEPAPDFTSSYKARRFLSQTNKGGVSDFIYFDNAPPAQEHFAVFVKVNDNNLADSL